LAFIEVNRLVSERIPIDKIISRYMKLEPTGNGYKGLCPFHKEKTPSFHINTSEGFYYCFGCQATGNVITFIMEKEGLSFSETIKKLAEEFNIKELIKSSIDPDSTVNKERTEIYNANKVAAVYFHRLLMKNREALEYLEKRGLDENVIKKFGIGFVGSGDEFISYMNSFGLDNNSLRRAGLIKLDNYFKPHSFFYNRIIIPIVSSKRVIGFGGRIFQGDGPKYINSPDTPVFNKKENLFGIDFVRQGIRDFPFVVLCEGYFDVIAMHRAGFHTAVAALGTAVTSAHLDIMGRYQKPVVVFLDGDEAGRKACRRIAGLKIPEKIDLRAAFISEEGADPDSLLLQSGGKEKVRRMLETSKPLFQELLDEQLEIYNKTENLEEKLKIEGKIREIVKNIPRRKFRTYSVYVQKNSENGIRLFYDRKKETERLKEEARAGKKTLLPTKNISEEELKIRKIIVISCLYPSYVPAVNKMLEYFVSVNYGKIVEKIIDLYYENEDMSFIVEEVDPFGDIREELADLEIEFVDKLFLRLQAFLLRSQNERTLELLKNEKSADTGTIIRKLIIENRMLKEVEKDNFVVSKTDF
jgi:DNA primase